ALVVAARRAGLDGGRHAADLDLRARQAAEQARQPRLQRGHLAVEAFAQGGLARPRIGPELGRTLVGPVAAPADRVLAPCPRPWRAQGGRTGAAAAARARPPGG